MTTPPTGGSTLLPGLPTGMLRIHRGEMIAVAIIGLILGLIAVFFPGATAVTIAIVFGSYLIASGIFRITAAFVADHVSNGMRWFTAIMGLLIIVAGVLCLSNPFGTLIVLAYVIGIGWIAEGVIDIMSGVRRTGPRRVLGVISGIVAIIAGVITFVLPAFGIATFVLVGGILLIAVSVTTLLTLPRATKVSR
ncbi:uncharacterized membrane protein HdeD (DUF308 family) [Glaciihabitans tibetensis]|uniref:Uncharacterized membrane protein HdeD (DUF308 family) n=1 Tax=Glaciihabitans tibetensis TaxID=1266600 RepID=A0A2T0VHL4_9MICO|nr:DUF308 domain-containing protein [Glaciihabitans tibetensis]PRY69690.1 uncharacterized membrane protein HdeD (DUF308 family) [Glaciihabitans tibetensis]